MRIAEICKDLRPREKLVRHGVGALSDAEVLALVLRTGTNNENAIDVAHRVLAMDLNKSSLTELQNIKGIGLAKACQVQALFEIANRFKSRTSNKQITTPKDVYDLMGPRLKDLDREEFWVLHLNSKNVVVREERVSVGTLNSSLIHPREVFKTAIKESSNAVILVHNHPSGDPTPSPEDEEVTRKLVEAGEMLDIKVLDHVVVGNDRWVQIKSN